MMDAVQLRILETMDDLHVEFLSLCRAQCYASEQLSSAFTEAVQLGMFAEADMEMLEEPGEPFTEVGRRIKRGSKFSLTIPACCANGYEGYFPTSAAFEEGGYEALSAKYAKGSAEKLIETSLEIIETL